MNNSIIEKQNNPLSLKRLEAMRVLYSSAKQFFAIQLILSVPTVILIAFVALAFDKKWFGLPHADIAWFVGASGVLFVVLDIFIWNPQINRRREKGAKIQQCFDCEVLTLQWDEIKYGRPPDQEDVEIWSKKYKHNPARDLKNWYRIEVAALPLNVARVICQRANCWWDMDLRRKYNAAVYLVGAVAIAAISTLAILLDCNVRTFFGLAVAPLLPFLTVAYKLVQDNRDAIARLQSMKDGIDTVWQRVLHGTITFDQLERFSSDIQVGIYNNRKSNPLVFDWVHQYAKPDHEDTTSKSTEQYVAEFEQAHPRGYGVQ